MSLSSDWRWIEVYVKTESWYIGYNIGRLSVSREILLGLLNDFFPQGIPPVIVAEISEQEDLNKLQILFENAVSFISKQNRAELLLLEMEKLLPDLKEIILSSHRYQPDQAERRQNIEARKNFKLVSLNLVMGYPVNWSRFKVLRDFVQNFYDSIGFEQWTKRFSCKQTRDSVIMRAENVVFDYQWLVHIGASTKREQPGKYAGKFGEGFKIASLVGYRDYNWNITMSSGDWRIYITSSDFSIDGQTMKSLAYLIEKVPHVNCSELIISGGVPIHEEIVKSVMLSFYYRENPLFGEPVWESSKSAVYKISGLAIPDKIPYTSGIARRGIVFSAYQALGSVDLPLIFCCHHSSENDRDRGALLGFQVISLINRVVYDISDPQAAIVILEYLKNHWNKYSSKKVDYTFFPVINRLVEIIARSNNAKTQFFSKYPDLLVTEKLTRTDHGGRYRRRLARTWACSTNKKYKFVQSAFSRLGYATLESKCHENGGFLEFQSASDLEKQLVTILECYAKLIFDDFFGFVGYPEVNIISNSSASWLGMANLEPITGRKINKYGLQIRYSLRSIALKRSLFFRENYGQAWSTYIHELTHVFGGDQSAGFSRALSLTMDICMHEIDSLSSLRAMWQQSFDKLRKAESDQKAA